MRRSWLVLAATALAGCSSPHPPLPPGEATVTLFGPTEALESWTTLAVEGTHVHADSIEHPCPVSAARATSCSMARGKTYGGRNRVALILRRSDEALIVDLPRLAPEETDRIYRAGEFTAAFERPLTKTEAALERGWVRAVRTSAGMEYELFLVLKPVTPGATYESIQIVTRVDAPSR